MRKILLALGIFIIIGILMPVGKVNAKENFYWLKAYGGSDRDIAYAVAIAPNRDIIVTGYTTSFGAGDKDVWVLRLDENGNVKWQKAYGGSGIDGANDAIVADNGDVVVVGRTNSFGVGGADFWVLRLDDNGNVKWQKTYGRSEDEWATAVTLAPNKDIIVAGVGLMRLSPDGEIKLAVDLNGNDIEVLSDGTAVLAAWGSDITVARFNVNDNYSEWLELIGVRFEVYESNAEVYATNAEVRISNAVINTTKAEVHDTEVEVETLWSYVFPDISSTQLNPTSTTTTASPTPPSTTPSQTTTTLTSAVSSTTSMASPTSNPETFATPSGSTFNPLYIAGALVTLLLIGGVATRARGKKGKTPHPPKDTEKPASAPTSKLESKTVLGFPPELLDKYEPLEFIGEGGFAKVFKVRRKSDGRIVALKIPRIDEKTSKTFIKEVSTWLHLNHPNIVRLYDVDILPIPYLEIEYVEGVNVDGKIVRDLGAYPKPVDEKTALKLIWGIAEGLKYAHSKGISHRDLKPLNILLKSDLTPKITDWGLAKLGTMSSGRSVFGYTPLYAAPEQLLPGKYGHTDHRTDIWQLGVTFYELLIGKPPFEGYTYEEVFGKIVDENYHFTSPSKINPALAKYDGIFEKLLAKKKESRYQSVEEFIKDLERLEEAEKKKAELEREVEKLKETLSKSVQALKQSTTSEEVLKNRRLVIDTLGKLALAYAELNKKAELLNTLNDLKFYTVQNLEDLTSAINTVELLIKENLPVSEDFMERLKVLVHNIKRENGA